MKAHEFDKMYRAETRFWWFVGKGRLVGEWAEEWFGASGDFLDLGCGAGANLERVQRRGDIPVPQSGSGGDTLVAHSHWIGVDASSEALRFCAERGHRRLIRGQAERLPFADDRFDGAMALDLFEHLEDDRAAAAELFRVLRPGGRLIVTVPAHPWLWGAHDLALGHQRRYRRQSLRELLTDSGFTIRRMTPIMGMLFPGLVIGKLWQKFYGNPADTMSYDWPRPLNQMLIRIMDLEAKWLRRWDLPLGTTLAAAAEKPGRA